MSLAGVCPRQARQARTAAPGPSPQHRLARFAAVGGAATALQLGLFAVLQMLVPVVWATVIAWSASTLLANQVNRSLTFGVHGNDGARRDFWVSTGLSVVGLAAGVLALAQVGDDEPALSLVVLVGVNAMVGLFRFLGLQRWFEVRTA